MSVKRRVLVLVVGLAIAVSGQDTAAQKGPGPVGALRIPELGNTSTPIYGFDFSAAASFDLTAGGKTTFNAIGVARIADGVSVELFKAIATGEHYPRVEITLFKPGTTTADATYGLTTAVVTSLKSAPGSEIVAFSYAQIDITSGGKTFCFNTVTNAGC